MQNEQLGMQLEEGRVQTKKLSFGLLVSIFHLCDHVEFLHVDRLQGGHYQDPFKG